MLNILTCYVKTVENEIDKTAFGRWFKPILKSTRIVQREVAIKAGIDPVSLSRILSGNHGVSKDTALALMEALNKMANKKVADIEIGLSLVAGIEKTSDSHEVLEGVTIQFDQSVKLSQKQKDRILEAVALIAKGVKADIENEVPQNDQN